MLSLLAVLSCVAALYAPTLNDALHGDDFVAFTEFKSKGFLEYSRDVFLFRDTNFYWRPLGCIFHYTLYAFFGLDPFVFRLAALLFFLGTLAGLYVFCLRERLGHWVALGCATVMGVLPSHVVSVTWVTNTSRLTAAFLVVACLLLLQNARLSKRVVIWESLAFLCFAGAVLSDEVTAGLAPLPLLYTLLLSNRRLDLRTLALRAVPYVLLVAIVVPLQFTYTIHDEARLNDYGFGRHILTSIWVIASQLSLPLASGRPLDVFVHRFSSAEWAAGAALLAYTAVLLVYGSRFAKFAMRLAAPLHPPLCLVAAAGHQPSLRLYGCDAVLRPDVVDLREGPVSSLGLCGHDPYLVAR